VPLLLAVPPSSVYQDTAFRRPIATWSTSTALMYAAQPNGSDSATINPAALNTGMSRLEIVRCVTYNT
jgi:hypothetical protein